MKSVTKKSLLGLVAVSGLVLAGCSNSNDSTTDTQSSQGTNSSGETLAADQTMEVVVPAEMGSADISLATDSYSFTALNNVYEGMYRLDETNMPVIAGAAEDAVVSDDGLTYKVKLREDATWSNGDSVTAADYVYSWQRTVNPETASGYAYMMAPVKNATAISEGEADVATLGIEATGEYEVTITLEQATPYFESLLAFPTFFPQNQAVVEEYGSDYALTSEAAVYNGPFVLEGFDGPGVDDAWTFAKNNDYWDADAVTIEAVNISVVKESSTGLNLFDTGEADDVVLSGELAIQNANHENYVTQPGATTQYLEMNQAPEDSPFRNENFRKAISYAMDRQQIVDNILGNGSLVANGLVPQDLAYNPETNVDFVEDADRTLEYDEAQAKEYWETAKSELGVDTISFSLMTSDTDQSKKLGEYVQGALQQTLEGVTVTLQTVPFSVRLERSNNGDFEMVMNNWIGDYADPINFLELFTTDSSYNRGKWLNDDYDSLVEAASTTDVNDPEARWNDMVEAEQVITDSLGIVPLFQNAEAHLRSDKIKGLVVHSVGAQYDYKDVYIVE
ncbi:ABC transporter substrate-binding protein [Enterococcus sp. LJL120]